MSNDLNQCNFIGRLGKDPESRFMPGSGDRVVSFSIACGSQWKDKQSNERKESVEWVNCTVFGKLADICDEYLGKGDQVFIGGRMKTDKYQAKDGSDRYSTKIIVDRMQMLGSKRDRDEDEDEDDDQDQPPPSRSPKPNGGASGFDDMDQDIPF